MTAHPWENKNDQEDMPAHPWENKNDQADMPANMMVMNSPQRNESSDNISEISQSVPNSDLENDKEFPPNYFG